MCYTEVPGEYRYRREPRFFLVAMIACRYLSGRMNRFDCLVLSGGGAKGAYGAGAAKALFSYRKANNLSHQLAFVGTSAGALNACILAAYGPDKLYELWKQLKPKSALGWMPRDARARALLNVVSPCEWFRIAARFFGYDHPYRLYGNSGLRALLTKTLSDVDFESFSQKAHLIIAVTDYSHGQMAAFYVSHLIDEFKQVDESLPLEDRPLRHFIRIYSKEMLIDALLASTAIPIAFPPVKIDGVHYVDGGIGNNTPTREAALFLRYVSEHKNISHGEAGSVFTVLQQPPGTLIHQSHRFGIKGLAWRTYELFHYTQMLPVIQAWHQINRAAERHSQRVNQFNEFLDSLQMESELRESIRGRFDQEFGAIRGRATRRRNFPMIEVQPTQELGSLLDFSEKSVNGHLEHGYTGMVHTLFNRKLIEPEVRDSLLRAVRIPLGVDKAWDEHREKPAEVAE